MTGKRKTTPRENFLQLCRGRSPAWVPFTLDVGAIKGFTDQVQQRFERETGESDPAEFFDYDLRAVSLAGSFGGADPRAYYQDLPPGTRFDEWGIGHWAGGAKDTYEKLFPPLSRAGTAEEIAGYPEPTISSAGVAAQVEAYQARGYPVLGYAGSIYEWSWWLRGLEQFMVDLLQNRQIAERILEKVCRYTCRLALASADAGIDALAFYDDAGTQKDLQISPMLWRAAVKPLWKKVLDAVRERHPQAVFFLHSCGNIRSILPDVIDLGFHILHPVQPECMDTAAIKAEYGGAIVLCGTISAQRTLPFGTPDEVRQETVRILDTLGKDRRCLLCPSNLVQPETPWENIVAFARAAREHRSAMKEESA